MLKFNEEYVKCSAHNKNYMSISVSVLTTNQVALNNCEGVRLEENPQSGNNHTTAVSHNIQNRTKHTQ